MKDTDALIEIRIDQESRIPKYRQIVNSIIADIERGVLSIGQRIPSINEISEEYYLSRDTVEKAYNVLKEKQIIVSAKGKGYYVARHVLPSKINVLVLLNKLSSYKLRIFNSIVTAWEITRKSISLFIIAIRRSFSQRWKKTWASMIITS